MIFGDFLKALVPIRSGAVTLDGADISKDTSYDRVRKGMGYVPQGREIFGRLTVEENLRMGLASRPARTPIPAELFELFPILKQFMHRRGGDLLGGQQQQLAIARALAMDPQMLILDEPTEGIQPNIVQQIHDVIVRLNREFGLTIVLVEQNVPFARRVSDRFIVMDKGRIVISGTGADLTDELAEKHLTF